jgi:hypothetical protein
VQVFGRRDDGLSTRRDGRRPKSVKARNRGGEAGAAPPRYGDFIASSEFGVVKSVGSTMYFGRSVAGEVRRKGVTGGERDETIYIFELSLYGVFGRAQNRPLRRVVHGL